MERKVCCDTIEIELIRTVRFDCNCARGLIHRNHFFDIYLYPYNNQITNKKMINKQQITIMLLAVTLSVVFVWFVIIDNYIVPSIISGNQISFQNGYESGANDAILGIMQQSYSCNPVSVWAGNYTVQLINVECLQSKTILENIIP